jgi:hypothetical protein
MSESKSDSKSEGSGGVFSSFVDDMRDKLHDSKLHDAKIALHHRK